MFEPVLPLENRPKILSETPKPEGLKLKPYHLWCPYCGIPTHFRKDGYLGVNRCELCGITHRDFFVKKSNRGGTLNVSTRRKK
jgi:hypothetical protein